MASRVLKAIYLCKSWDLLHKETDACDICKAVKMKCHMLDWETKLGRKKRCALFHPALIPDGLKDKLKRKSWQLLQITKWEQHYGFGQTSQLYLSSEYFLHRDTLTYIKVDFFPPLRWGINKLLRNPNLSIIIKENKRNVLRTGGKVFRTPLFQEFYLLTECKRRLVTITEKIIVTKRYNWI